MIRDIYLQFGGIATVFPLTHFCLHNKELLEENGFYYPLLEDFIERYSIQPASMEIYGNLWLYQPSLVGLFQNAAQYMRKEAESFVLPSSTLQLAEQLAQYLENKPHLHSLCLFYSQAVPSEIFRTTLETLQAVFPDATIHHAITSLPPDRELESRFLQYCFNLNFPSIKRLVQSSGYISSALYYFQKIPDIATELLQQKVLIRYIMDDTESLPIWQRWIHIPKPTRQEKYTSIFFSPDVLAFQRALSNRVPLVEPYYMYPWLLQDAFMQYGTCKDRPLTYMQPACRKQVRANYAMLALQPFEYRKNVALEDVSDVSTSLSSEKTLELASLLPSSFRIMFLDVDICLSYQHPFTRNAYRALLLLEGQLDDEVLQNFSESKNSIRTIYFQVGNLATTYPLTHFCLENTNFLEEHGFYYPVLRDILDDYSADCDWLDTFGNYWFCGYTQNAYFLGCVQQRQKEGMTNNPIIPPAHVLQSNLLKLLESKPHIHSLCFFLGSNNAMFHTYNQETVVSTIEKLKELFPNATILPKITFLPPDRELEGIWLSRLHQHTPMSLSTYVEDTAHAASASMSSIKTYEALKKIFQSELAVSQLMNEGESLSVWQLWANIPKPAQAQIYRSLFASPDVLAFILSIQKRSYPYMQQHAWCQEDAFFLSGTKEECPKTYLRPFWRKKVRSNYDTFASLPCMYKEELVLDDVSNASLSLTLEKALHLASLLSSSFRKNILCDVDISKLTYQAQSTRNAYGAVLFLEGQLDNEALQGLTQAPKGLCLPLENDIQVGGAMSNPKVAVVTMAYNQRDFIEKNIQSVLMQETTFPVTHIICDDASTDGTQEIILDYAKKYPHITPILCTYNHKGRVALELFDQISSPYVALCDGDDYFTDPKKLQKQADYLDQNPLCALCFHPVMTLYEDKPDIGQIYPPLEQMPRGLQAQYYLRELLTHNFIQANSVMYRWRFQDGLPAWFSQGLCPEDRYWHLIHAECGRIGYQNAIMAVYRRHAGSLFHQTEVDIIKHRHVRGIAEVSMYEVLDLHFEGRFAEIIHTLGKNVFMELAQDAAKTKDSTHLLKFIERFPTFQQYVKKPSTKQK